jgi:PhzF family phenazine biosynthesis protein
MKIPVYQVDAFASALFQGNPAAVCPLETWLPEDIMQSIAAENNLAETAFFCRENGRYRLRWFTPESEVDLCGHATLASAYVVFEHLDTSAQEVAFDTRSGELRVERRGQRLEMSLPSRPLTRIETPPGLSEALGVEPLEVGSSRDWVAILESEEQVRNLKPDLRAVANLPVFAVAVTAQGREVDFVSRFFAPAKGVPEDPVTGSAHCSLVPYWADKLGKTLLHARQLSRRGGELECELVGDRVVLRGQAVLYLTGTLHLGRP